MERLSAKDYKALMIAIYNAQINNIPPPEFTGSSKIVATMVFPCIERRKAQSEFGRAGVAARLFKSKNAENSVSSDLGDPANHPASHPANQSKEKKNKIEYSYNKAKPSKADAPAAKESSSFDLDDFFEAAVRRTFAEANE